jgi:hypothetical protein
MTEAQLKFSRQARGHVKRSMTVLEKYLSTFQEDSKLESLIDGELKLEDLKVYREKFEKHHNKMVETAVLLNYQDEKLEEFEKEFEHFEQR